MVSLLSLIVVLGVLIFVHELGHFIAAKAVGIGVPRFSIGLGPRTPIHFMWGETEFVLSWIPFGGYVKMASKEELEAYEALEGGETPYDFPEEKMFESKPLWARIVVILAGVTMNVIFAWGVYLVLSMTYGDRDIINTTVARFRADSLPAGAEALAAVPLGARITSINGNAVESFADIGNGIALNLSADLRIEFDGAETVQIDASDYGATERIAILNAFEPLLAPRVGQVQPSTPASEAGLEPLDLIVRVNGDTVAQWVELVARIEASPEVPLQMDVQRGDLVFAMTVVPESRDSVDRDTGEIIPLGRLGVYNHVEVRHRRYGLIGGVKRASRHLMSDITLVGGGLVGLFAGRVSPKELGGPILIGQIAGQFAQAGLESFMGFLAMFSVNLAILNMLPIPVLDGGQFVVLLAEGVRGKPLPE